VGTILTGLLSFMYDNQPTTGSITSTRAEKQRLARESLATNAKSATFAKVFPEWVELHQKRLAEAAATRQAGEPQLAAGAAGAAGAAAAGGKGEGTGLQAAGSDEVGAPAAAAAAAGRAPSLVTIAAILVVLAIAVVPLLSATGGRGGLSMVADSMK
jgi:ubiquitin-conjugating enzyme E2 J2